MVDVTIPDEETFIEFDASGVGPHAFNFTYFEKADLRVSVDGVDLEQGDFIHTPNTAKAGGYDGGSITLNTAVPGGAGLLWRETQTTRTDNYTAGPLSPQAISRDMTRMVAMAQDARRDIGRSLRAALGSEIDETLAAAIQIVADALAGGGNWAGAIEVKATNGLVFSTLADRFAQIPDFVLDFGGVGDDTANNDVAFANVAAAGVSVCYLPAGTYLTTLFLLPTNSPRFVGPGRIHFASGSWWPGNAAYMDTRGAKGTNSYSNFDGGYERLAPEYWRLDFQRAPDLSSYYFDKSATPHYIVTDHFDRAHSGCTSKTTGSVLAGATSATLISTDGLIVGSEIGFITAAGTIGDIKTLTNVNAGTGVVQWVGGLANPYASGSTVTTAFRSMQANTIYAAVHRGWGDCYNTVMRMQVAPLYAPLAGQDHVFNIATGGLTGGDIYATGNDVYCTGIEMQIEDAGNSAAMLMFPLSIRRDSNVTTKGQFSGFVFAQASGAYPIDFGISLGGTMKSGLNMVLANLGTPKAAITLAKGHRVYTNGTGTPIAGVTLYGNNPGASYHGQRTSDDAWEVVVEGEECVVAHPSGDVQFPNTAAVAAYKSAATANATGDGTSLTVIFDTEVMDQNGRYNSGTGIFTATRAGLYLITGAVQAYNIGGSHTAGRVTLVTSSGVDYRLSHDPTDLVTGDGVASLPFMAHVSLAAGETLKVELYIAGGTKTVTVGGGGLAETFLGISMAA